MTQTILTLGSIAIPSGAGRGIKQTLVLDGNGEIRRDVNGNLVDLTIPALRKFKSSVSCADQSAPSIAGIWRGAILTVGCAVEVSEVVATTTPTLNRTPVSGSIRAAGTDGTYISVSGTTLSALDGTGHAVVFYRPQLTMMVTDIQIHSDEWTAGMDWTIELQEV